MTEGATLALTGPLTGGHYSAVIFRIRRSAKAFALCISESDQADRNQVSEALNS
jgi:hypothetical protein